ncbi:MAG: hypothetical protein M1827_003178 [Pycnora praestabilis]|nr:MAG: hypothetical protein M1827_003178 [Pycnora praestabilis]
MPTSPPKRPSPAHRPSTNTSSTSKPPLPPPKPPTALSPTCVISETAQLVGTQLVTVFANTVVHPKAKLLSTLGTVVVGEGCIVCEKAVVGLGAAEAEEKIKGKTGVIKGSGDGGGDIDEGERQEGVVLEQGVVVEVGALVEARRVGEGTVVEVGAKIGRGCVIGKHCKIAPLSKVPPNETLPDFTVIYGNNERRIDKSGLEELRMKLNEKHVETLRRLIKSDLAKWQ